MIVRKVKTRLRNELIGYIKIDLDWDTPFFFESGISGLVIFAKSLQELQEQLNFVVLNYE